MARSGGCWPNRRTDWSAARTRCWWSTTPPSPRRARGRSASLRNFCGELGKQANCQSLVSLTLARHEVPVPVGLRLFLPTSWTGDPARCAAAGVPEAAREAQIKPTIALAEIDRVIAAGTRFGCVLADAGYGMSAAFRQGLKRA